MNVLLNMFSVNTSFAMTMSTKKIKDFNFTGISIDT